MINFLLEFMAIMILMDFYTDKEFHPIFNRTSKRVNLKGAGSPAEINKRLTKKIKQDKKKTRMIKEAIKEGLIKKRASTRWLKKIRSDTKDTKKLIFAGFGRRTIDEAITRPRGKVALTLKHGNKKAKEILLKRARKRLGSLRKRRRKKKR